MYFHTDNPFTLATLARLMLGASQDGRKVRLNVDEAGRLSYKIGEGMWSAPIDSTPDPYRDNSTGYTETVYLNPQG